MLLASFGRRAPIAARLALRDLARYRARSGSALAAISLGVFIAALVCILTAQRYGNVLDYAGPNLASNQVIVYTPNGGPGGGGPGNGPGGQSASATASTPQAQAAVAQASPRPSAPTTSSNSTRQRLAAARRGRAFLVRTGVRGHAPAAAGVRDQGVRRQP